jgi:hypothetical protein
MRDFIETLRAKPEYIRRRIALAAAAGVTATVALLWVVALATSGAFALGGPDRAPELTATFSERTSNTASALSAAASLFSGAQSEEGIEVVEVESSSTLDAPPAEERTVIPF